MSDTDDDDRCPDCGHPFDPDCGCSCCYAHLSPERQDWRDEVRAGAVWGGRDDGWRDRLVRRIADEEHTDITSASVRLYVREREIEARRHRPPMPEHARARLRALLDPGVGL